MTIIAVKTLIKKTIIIIVKAIKPVIRAVDSHLEKDPLLWVFPQCYLERTLKENALAVIDRMAKKQATKKICILYYPEKNKNDKQRIEYQGYKHIRYVNIFTLKGLYYLLRANTIFVTHGHHDILWRGIYGDKHKIVNLWHGIPIKRIRHTCKEAYEPEFFNEEDRTNTYVISSSKVDQGNMQRSFSLKKEKVLLTGLPRNDFLHYKVEELPVSLIEQYENLKKTLGEKKLVLYAPTWRERKLSDTSEGGIKSHFDYNSESLQSALEKNNLILGLRLHPRSQINSEQLNNDSIVDLSSNHFPSTQMILRNTEILITDYSSIWVDFLQMKRKVIGFIPDHTHYLKNNRELLYEFGEVFPGQVYTNFTDLVNYFESSYEIDKKLEHYKLKESLELFHKYQDVNNTERVIEALTNYQ